tara:strand:+ start:888 stop:1217 length:330 start_codon:yes stop_codon:yes gene_type:complete
MATSKVKGTSKKIKELKGIKPEKINEQELAQLQAALKTIDSLTGEVGGIEVRKHSLLRAMENVHSRLEAQRIRIKEEYGTDNINLQTGEITYTDSSNTTKENGEVNKED